MSKGGEKRGGRKIQDMEEASGQKELTEADVAAAQKEPTEGKPRMEYKARLCTPTPTRSAARIHHCPHTGARQQSK